jgi:hypothetical protein
MNTITVAAPTSAGHGNEFDLHLSGIVGMETKFHRSNALRVGVGRDAEFVCNEGRCQLGPQLFHRISRITRAAGYPWDPPAIAQFLGLGN